MFKLSSLGVAVAILFGVFAAPSIALAQGADAAAAAEAAKAAKAAGMKAAPALIQAAAIPCTLTDARQVGTGKGADGKPATIFEVACSEGMGFIIASEAGAPQPIVYDCMMMSKPSADGKPNPLMCRLPENANPAAGMQAYVNQSGHPTCQVTQAKFLGLTQDKSKKIDEVACADGRGFVMTMAMNGPPAPTADNCLAYAGSNVSCTLTTQEQELQVLPALVKASGKCATVTKSRYVLSTQDGSDYYEVACSDGKGYMLASDKTGKLSDTVPCAQAYQIGNGCQLTDTRQAETQQNSVYTGLAKKAGFDCTVSKYALFPQSDDKKDIVELACANRPDGAVGIFPSSGAGMVYDCLRSQDEGYKCTFTPQEATYARLTAQLKSKGQGACVVSAARPFGHADDGSDFVEVACADGGTGLVLIYDANKQEPVQVNGCGQMTTINGGCQLPRGKKS